MNPIELLRTRRSASSLLVIAGEASGDLLASKVLECLGSSWRAWGVGGVRARAQGLDALFPVEAFSLVGLTEVLGAVPRVMASAACLLEAIGHDKPDVALLVDLPDFNCRLGPLLAAHSVPVVYFGAPQAWAWRPRRAKQMARWVSALACLFPFEPEFFASKGVNARFVGHPRAADAALLASSGSDAIALMPGSRKGELRAHAPVLAAALPMLRARFPGYRLRMPVAPSLTRGQLEEAFGPALEGVELFEGDALEVLASSALALVAAGTAVTECVLMGVPHVVFYRLRPTTYAIARRLVRTPYVAMSNILASSPLVPELLQAAFEPRAVVGACERVLAEAGPIRERLSVLAGSLMPSGGQSTASLVAELIRQQVVGEERR